MGKWLRFPNGELHEEPVPDVVIQRHLTSGYTTKDSGAREQFSTGMQRDTQAGKPRFDLVMPLGQPFDEQMLTRWAGLMARGAEKYDDRNWEQAATQVELDRYLSSAFRHFVQWLAGDQDEDHAAAVFFNIAGAEYVKWRMKDDHRTRDSDRSQRVPGSAG